MLWRTGRQTSSLSLSPGQTRSLPSSREPAGTTTSFLTWKNCLNFRNHSHAPAHCFTSVLLNHLNSGLVSESYIEIAIKLTEEVKDCLENVHFSQSEVDLSVKTAAVFSSCRVLPICDCMVNNANDKKLAFASVTSGCKFWNLCSQYL